MPHEPPSPHFLSLSALCALHCSEESITLGRADEAFLNSPRVRQAKLFSGETKGLHDTLLRCLSLFQVLKSFAMDLGGSSFDAKC